MVYMDGIKHESGDLIAGKYWYLEGRGFFDMKQNCEHLTCFLEKKNIFSSPDGISHHVVTHFRSSAFYQLPVSFTNIFSFVQFLSLINALPRSEPEVTQLFSLLESFVYIVLHSLFACVC